MDLIKKLDECEKRFKEVSATLVGTDSAASSAVGMFDERGDDQ